MKHCWGYEQTTHYLTSTTHHDQLGQHTIWKQLFTRRQFHLYQLCARVCSITCFCDHAQTATKIGCCIEQHFYHLAFHWKLLFAKLISLANKFSDNYFFARAFSVRVKAADFQEIRTQIQPEIQSNSLGSDVIFLVYRSQCARTEPKIFWVDG